MQGNLWGTKVRTHLGKGRSEMRTDKVCVFLAEGFEEIEGLTVVDILRRADIKTVTVSVSENKNVTGAHGITVQADCIFAEAYYGDVKMIVLPGGMPGTANLERHQGLAELLHSFYTEEKHIAAICAAPSILGKRGMLEGRKAVSYPAKESELHGAQVLKDSVVQDGFVITSRGMGTAIPFALKLTAVLCGEEKANEIKEAIIF